MSESPSDRAPGAEHIPDTSHAHFRALPIDIEAFRQLAELALDLRSTWNHASDELWRRIEPVLRDLTHNPWAVLRTASRAQIENLAADPAFRAKLEEQRRKRHEARRQPRWFQHAHAKSPLSRVAYFSMEFMLSEALPIYSGGLGNVAG